MDRRLIEETFPIKEVGEESVREKRLRYGHISTLHVWWARRPLSSSRATIYSSLVKPPTNLKKLAKEQDFIINLSKWENSNNLAIIEKAKKEIIQANQGKRPKVLDPFGGGGSIPLEATRLGCETYALDYNPVACLLLKCVAELPQKYNEKSRLDKGLTSHTQESKFLKDLKKWQKWVNVQAEDEIGKFYPKENDGSIIVGYIWLKKIKCQNPSCRSEISLSRNYYLSKKKDHTITLFPFVTKNKTNFKIIDTSKEDIPKGFDPNKGSISKAIVTCPVCQSTIDGKTTRKLFNEGQSTEQLTAVISYNKQKVGKNYRVANQKDTEIFHKAEEYLKRKRKEILQEIGMDPIPDEDLPPTGTLGFRIQKYGFKKWGDIFNSRQKLTLLIFSEKIRKAHDMMIKEDYTQEYAKAIITFLALGVDRLANYGSSLCYLNSTGGRGVANTFGRHVLNMVPNYAESNPFNPAGAGWLKACESNEGWINHVNTLTFNLVNIKQTSATSIPYTDNYFDAVFTDPPYYDNIAYSYLSDFFYVWLKRIIGGLYPDLFSTPLTPKSEEIVAYSNIPGGAKKAKELFEKGLAKSFAEINRVLKQDGIAVIVYAHKSTDGWETLINSLLESDLTITCAWPIHTEMQGRLESRETASLASSIYMVCRKWKKEPHASYNNVKKQMQEYLDKKLDFLWSQDIRGADFFISAIGSAIEVFGKYEKITDNADNEIKVPQLLEDVRKIVSEYSIKKVLRGDIGGEISTMTRFYVLWRSAYGQAKVPFDDARKLATSLGVNLEQEWNKGFIKKEIGLIRVIGPEDRSVDEIKEPTELIDVLHKVLILWRNNKKEEYEKLLTETKYANNDTFKRVAQAISESLPDETQEKKWLDGFLTGFTDSDKIDGKQTKLD